MGIKFSVVIPAYQSEKWINNSINCIMQQSYKDWELIIINDGSTDKTADICRERALNNDKIVVIDKENGGVSEARNLGIQMATGQYIMFLDADDLLDLDTLSECAEILEQDNFDILFFDYVLRKDNKDEWHTVSCEEGAMEGERVLWFYTLALNRNVAQNIGTKVYKADVIKELRFDKELSICEDSLFSLEAVARSKKLYYIKKPYYFYQIYSKDSLSQKIGINYYLSHIVFLDKLYMYISSDMNGKFDMWYYVYYMDVLHSILKKIGKRSPEMLNVVQQNIKNNDKIVVAKKVICSQKHSVSNKKRIIYWVIWENCFFLYKLIYTR